MSTRRSALMVIVATTLVAQSARGEEEPPLRISLAPVVMLSALHRSSTEPRSRTATGYGGEFRIHRSTNGFVAAYTHCQGWLFAPRVDMLDAGYSYRIVAARSLRGLTGAVYTDLGLVGARVQDAPPARDHFVVGPRLSIAADVHLWNVLVGPTVTYRAGVPLSGTPDAWEHAFSLGIRTGVAFDAD